MASLTTSGSPSTATDALLVLDCATAQVAVLGLACVSVVLLILVCVFLALYIQAKRTVRFDQVMVQMLKDQVEHLRTDKGDSSSGPITGEMYSFLDHSTNSVGSRLNSSQLTSGLASTNSFVIDTPGTVGNRNDAKGNNEENTDSHSFKVNMVPFDTIDNPRGNKADTVHAQTPRNNQQQDATNRTALSDITKVVGIGQVANTLKLNATPLKHNSISALAVALRVSSLSLSCTLPGTNCDCLWQSTCSLQSVLPRLNFVGLVWFRNHT